MSALEPSGPAQPTLQQGYETKGNPAETSAAEKDAAGANAAANNNAGKTDTRVPTKQTSDISEATPSSLGLGVHGAPPGEEAKGLTHEDVGRNKELDGEQMRAPGEGEVAAAVADKPGAGGEQQDLASDLDRKKAEQAPAREAAKEERREKVDVAGILAERSAPANPVGKNNYPNTGSEKK